MARSVDIVLIESRADDVMLVFRALDRNRFRYIIKIFYEAEEALAYLFGNGRYGQRERGDPPRLILLDFNLPKISGREMLERLRSDPRTGSIPVIMLTASTREYEMFDPEGTDRVGCIDKSEAFDVFAEELRTAILHWLGG